MRRQRCRDAKILTLQSLPSERELREARRYACYIRNSLLSRSPHIRDYEYNKFESAPELELQREILIY